MLKRIFGSSEFNSVNTRLKNFTKELDALGSKRLSLGEVIRFRNRYKAIIDCLNRKELSEREYKKLYKAIINFKLRFRQYDFFEETDQTMTSSDSKMADVSEPQTEKKMYNTRYITRKSASEKYEGQHQDSESHEFSNEFNVMKMHIVSCIQDLKNVNPTYVTAKMMQTFHSRKSAICSGVHQHQFSEHEERELQPLFNEMQKRLNNLTNKNYRLDTNQQKNENSSRGNKGNMNQEYAKDSQKQYENESRNEVKCSETSYGYWSKPSDSTSFIKNEETSMSRFHQTASKEEKQRRNEPDLPQVHSFSNQFDQNQSHKKDLPLELGSKRSSFENQQKKYNLPGPTSERFATKVPNIRRSTENITYQAPFGNVVVTNETSEAQVNQPSKVKDEYDDRTTHYSEGENRYSTFTITPRSDQNRNSLVQTSEQSGYQARKTNEVLPEVVQELNQERLRQRRSQQEGLDEQALPKSRQTKSKETEENFFDLGYSYRTGAGRRSTDYLEDGALKPSTRQVEETSKKREIFEQYGKDAHRSSTESDQNYPSRNYTETKRTTRQTNKEELAQASTSGALPKHEEPKYSSYANSDTNKEVKFSSDPHHRQEAEQYQRYRDRLTYHQAQHFGEQGRVRGRGSNYNNTNEINQYRQSQQHDHDGACSDYYTHRPYQEHRKYNEYDQYNQSYGDERPPTIHRGSTDRHQIDNYENERRKPRPEVAEEAQEEVPLQILDVHQYFRNDFDLNSVDDLEYVERIKSLEDYARTFEPKVQDFEGEKYSLEYFVLDEKLMRLIEKLDSIKCQDDQTATERKVEVIEYINNLHATLDTRAKDD